MASGVFSVTSLSSSLGEAPCHHSCCVAYLLPGFLEVLEAKQLNAARERPSASCQSGWKPVKDREQTAGRLMGAARPAQRGIASLLSPSQLPHWWSLAVWGALKVCVRVGSMRGVALRWGIPVQEGQERHVENLWWRHCCPVNLSRSLPFPFPRRRKRRKRA